MLTLTPQTNNNQPWKMLGWLFAIQVLVALVGRSLAPLGPLFEEDLSLTKAQIGMLPAALFLGQSIVSVPAGFLADRIGTKNLLISLTFCLGISFALTSITSSYLIILILIMLGGFGYGAMHPTSNRGIIYWFPVKKRGTAMGIKQMGVTFGSAMAALILLPMAAAWGWRPVLVGAGFLLMIVGLIAFRKYNDPVSVKNNPAAKPSDSMLSSIHSVTAEKQSIHAC